MLNELHLIDIVFNSHLGCVCDAGFVGPVCEFTDMGLNPPPCNLECFNMGVCRKGAKDLSVLKKFGIMPNNRALLDQYNDDFEHCVCPSGYAGLQCEFKVDVCPGGNHVCLNGGSCTAQMGTENTDTMGFGCDCREAQTTETRFAGTFCEMESTSFCTVTGEKTIQGKGLDAFCTNGGGCKALVTDGQQ